MSVTLDKRTCVSWHNGNQDKRYSVALEFCGYETPRYVARFCGDWISSHRMETEAWTAGQVHKDARTMDQ